MGTSLRKIISGQAAHTMQDMNLQDQIENLRDRIEVLNRIAWHERGLKWDDYKKWVQNFSKTECNLALPNQEWTALYLLSNFLYFSNDLVRKLLKSLFLDIFQTPLIHKIRRANSNTLNTELIEKGFHEELGRVHAMVLRELV